MPLLTDSWPWIHSKSYTYVNVYSTNSLQFRQAPSPAHKYRSILIPKCVSVHGLCMGAHVTSIIFSLLPHPDPRPNMNLPPGSIVQPSMNVPLYQAIAILCHCTGQLTNEGIIGGNSHHEADIHTSSTNMHHTSRSRGAYIHTLHSHSYT